MAASVASWVISAALELIVKSNFQVRVFVVLLVSAIPMLVLAFRVRRKLGGEPIIFDPPVISRPLETVRLIRRTESPKLFWMLVFLDVLIWSSASLVMAAPLFWGHSGSLPTR